MEDQDLTFRTSEGTFNYRVGAIIIRDKKILMIKNEGALYYYSVGGRVKLNETMLVCNIRTKRCVGKKI